ncbi:CUB and sushi domain-containing protein 1 [Blomia tropicalis]|nr:CUB and sushi domain-containing protein 1 [Blomia tropicalis]
MDLIICKTWLSLQLILIYSILTLQPYPTFATSLSSPSSPSAEIRAVCGFPGSPKNGRVLHLLEKYEENMVVTFECDTGFYLLGTMTRTCQSNGTWSGDMPICDQSINILGQTAASEALNNYPPQLAVDGNFRTCFFSNRRKPRWWRVELPKQSMQNQSIISVALTLPPIHADLHFSIYVIETSPTTTNDETGSTSASKYHKCATFRGVFSSKTILVQCAKNNGGLRGNFLQIEDDHPQLEYFGLCEVDIFVERDSYKCGQVEVPANGFVINKDNQTVEYSCNDEYRLIGDSIRTCNVKTGQWLNNEPYCERITCQSPPSIANGMYRVYNDYLNVPVIGTRTVYECNPGFILTGLNDTRVCDATGEWNGSKPYCEAIDCGHPENLLLNVDDFMLSGAHFQLINGSTKYSSYAKLICPTNIDLNRSNHSKSITSLLFRCREDSIWTEVNELVEQNSTNTGTGGRSTHSCVRQRHNGLLYFYGSGHKLRKSYIGRDNSLSMLHFLAAVVLLAFFSIVIIVILLFKRDIIECPENFCSPFNDRFKSFGQSMKQSASNAFINLNESIQSYIGDRFGKKRSNDEQQGEPSFSITPSIPDIEAPRTAADDTINTSIMIDDNKGELDSALATFYEEITNAAKQVFSEDTDRKLLRAARIAAELDVIKNQQESNYHWIYATPPHRNGTSSLPPSLTPSMHESCQIPSSSQIYAKVDLIRKHRYRKEKETSVYQVPPRPRHMEIDPNSSLISQTNGSTVYQLRKAISSPDAVFVESDYATIRRLRLADLANGTVADADQTTIEPQQLHSIPIQTLL